MRKFIGLSLLPVFSLAFAVEAPVEDLGSPGVSVPSQRTMPRTAPAIATPVAAAAAPVPTSAPASTGGSQNQVLMDMHYEVQTLKDEVRDLRGLVEEQANELRQLRQRQLDDYQDLDGRISSGATMSAPPSPRANVPATRPAPTSTSTLSEDELGDIPQTREAMTSTTAAPATSTSPPSEGEYEAYTSTYNLLKARKIDEAVAGFNVFVAKFPNGQYTANAYYWLGEIYMLENNLNDAAKAFSVVKDRFPAHRKANDAKFKLAKVYHLQGDVNKSKGLLTEVAATDSGAASLARAYLNDNF